MTTNYRSLNWEEGGVEWVRSPIRKGKQATILPPIAINCQIHWMTSGLPSDLKPSTQSHIRALLLSSSFEHRGVGLNPTNIFRISQLCVHIKHVSALVKHSIPILMIWQMSWQMAICQFYSYQRYLYRWYCIEWWVWLGWPWIRLQWESQTTL